MAQHDDIIALIEANRDLVPEGVYLGYAVMHTHHADGSEIPIAERIACDRDLKRNLRREVGVRGARARATDIPADASDAATCHVTIELYDTASGETVYHAVELDTLLGLLTNPGMGAEQRRQDVRGRIASALADLNARKPT